MFKKLITAAVLMASATLVQAAPITITQVFSDVALYEYQMQGGLSNDKVSGDWIFKATLDTDTPDTTPWPDVISYVSYGAKVTLTQASLGMFDEVVTNLRFFYVQMDMLGFASNAAPIGPLTRSEQFGIPINKGQFPLAVGDVFHSADSPSLNGFESSYEGFQFAKHESIFGRGYNAKSTISVAAAAAVPEPASALLMICALAGLAAARRQRRQM